MILENPWSKKIREADREAAADLFRIPPGTANGEYLLLRRYVSATPERFFDRSVQAEYASWLDDRHDRDANGLRDYFRNNIAEIERALLFLHEINVEDWHDTAVETTNDWQFLRFVDRRIHPTYLRLLEGVLAPLARIVAHFSRCDRNAGTDGLDIYAIAQELTNGPLSTITDSYRPTVRNGIGHGGITYEQFEITYRDKRGNEETVGIRDVVRLCDDLLDDCNGLAAALAVFMVKHRQEGYPVPEELLVQELREETMVPWWSIEGAIRSRIPAGNQLLIYAEARSRDFQKIQFSAIQSGILAEAFAPGYERYFLSIRGRPSGVGWAALIGERLRAHRVAKENVTAYTDVLESMFFHPLGKQPRWLRTAENMIQAFRINWPAARREWEASRGVLRSVPRTAKLHPSGWRTVLNGAVIVESPSPTAIRQYRRRIIKTALSIASAVPKRARVYPLGFAQIAVFCRDYRTRQLNSFGLGADLVCTVRYQTIKRIRSPDIVGSTVEVAGPWRIAWNRAWLERGQVTLHTPVPWQVVQPHGVV